ncbi:MAG: cyclic nucleotide-binding domain-containing protein, partial [Chloroflexota bacterium]
MATQALTENELLSLLAGEDEGSLPIDETDDAPIFSLLSSIDRGQLSNLTSVRNYARGDIVFNQGEAGDALYIIRSGRVV